MTTEKEPVSKLLHYRSQAAQQSVQLWKSKGGAEAYAEEQKTLKILQEVLCKRIVEVEREIKEVEPLVKISEITLESQRQTWQMNSRSVIVLNEHKECAVNEVQKFKEMVNDLLDRYSKHIDECKEELENNNPKCKILQDVTNEKKKVKLDCMILEQRIKDNRRKNQILKKVSYDRIIDFAKSWLERRSFEEKRNALNQLTSKKKDWMCKLMEVIETSKFKQKMRYIKDTMYTPIVRQIKFPQPTDSKSVDKKPDIEKNDTNKKVSVNESSNPFSGLQLLLENTVSNQLKQTKPDCPTQHFVNNKCVQKSVFKPDHSKVLILNNQILNVSPETHQPKPTLTREERSKGYDAKLQKVFTRLKRKISHQPSTEVARAGPLNANTTNTEIKKAHLEIRGSKVSVEKSKNKDIVPSQESMLYSQEEGEMRFASQQSDISSERNILSQVDKINPRVPLDINQNESIPVKPNKRVTFAINDTASDSFFGGSKQMNSSVLRKKDDYHFAMLNMNSDVSSALKASENEYNQFSLNFGGAAAGGTFSNFAGMDNSTGLFKKPNNPTGDVLSQNLQTSQSHGLNMENGSENLNLNNSYNYGDISGYSDTGDYASMLLSPTGDYQETSGSSINQQVEFTFGTTKMF